MKIIGGHDYYDGAGYGVDETICFLRDKSSHFGHIDSISDTPFDCPQPNEISINGQDSGRITFFCVVIGGELHPGIELYIRPKGVKLPNVAEKYQPCPYAYIYDLNDALDVLRTMSENSMINYRYLFNTSRKNAFFEKVEKHMSRKISDAQTNWLIDHNAAVLTTHFEGENVFRGKTVVRINHALLKSIDFYKCVDPATAHMRISGYISGVLPQNRETIQISDKDRIVKAGFDTVTSFRKSPQKK